jgi:hypothetical protein
MNLLSDAPGHPYHATELKGNRSMVALISHELGNSYRIISRTIDLCSVVVDLS